jgi:putative aldouronate transport system permease protein
MTAGYGLSRKDLRGRSQILKLLAFTMFFSGGMIPTYMIVKGLGLVNTIWAMVIPNAVSVWNLLITRSFFETTIPDELLNAAMIDGCGNLRFFARIVMPLSKAIVAVMVLFYAIVHWNSFFSALIYLESERLYPLQIILRNILIANQQQGEMMADVTDLIERQNLAELLKYGVIVVASVPVLVLYPFVQKYFVSGIMVGSVKG